MMRLLFAIMCSALLSAENASAEVCLTIVEGRNLPVGRSPVAPGSPRCSLIMVFGNALSDFYGAGVFISDSTLHWAPHKLTTSETGQPMIKQNILAKIISPEGVAEIRRDPRRFLAVMSQFEAEVKPYLCQFDDTSAFIKAGGVAEYNIRVAAGRSSGFIFNDFIATVYLDKESCEGI